MFERFSAAARRTVVLAQEEARGLRHNYIGTEHILLGLLRDQEGVAARALADLGVSLDAARERVLEVIGEGEKPSGGHIPFTPRNKKVLELALREAKQLRHKDIGNEHILLGLIREGKGVAAQTLVALGADLDSVRGRVIQRLAEAPEHAPGREGELGEEPSEEPGYPSASPPPGRRRTPAADQVVAAAEQLAGESPMGSHHLLEALARFGDGAAARTLDALGLDPDALAAKLDELGIEGTSDLTDEEAAARQMEVRVADGEVQVVLRDDTAVELAQAVTGHLGGPVRGDDPAAGGLVGLHRQLVHFLTELRARLAPPAAEAPEPEAAGVPTLVRDAVRDRLRRRSS